MQALNQAYEDLAAFRKFEQALTDPAAPPTRNIDREVDEWNARVDREKFEKARRKIARRSIQERMEVTKP